jgi:hypothetical protein
VSDTNEGLCFLVYLNRQVEERVCHGLLFDVVSDFAFNRRSLPRQKVMSITMSLLAFELGSLDPESCIPLLKQALEVIKSKELRVLIYLVPELLSKLDSAAKRAGRIQSLQKLISALYICSASNVDVSCDIIFADWCGYQVEKEIWDYHDLYTAGTPAIPKVHTGVSRERLPRSLNAVDCIELNFQTQVSEFADEQTTEKDHAVVAGHSTPKVNVSRRHIRPSPRRPQNPS